MLPADHSFRPHHHQCVKRCWNQSRQPYEQQAIDIVEGYFLWRLAPEHIELMAKMISASRRVLDRHNPITAAQSNLSTSIIKQEHHPIRVVSPAVSSFRQAQGS
jgi:hypothetical protein